MSLSKKELEDIALSETKKQISLYVEMLEASSAAFVRRVDECMRDKITFERPSSVFRVST